MLIVFDGMDNAGKTTIAKKLQSAISDHVYFKYSIMREKKISITDKNFSKSGLHVFDYTSKLLNEISKTQNIKLILDRHFPSEYVYGGIYRNLDLQDILPIDKTFSEIKKHLIVICHKTNGKTKADELYDTKDYETIRQKFLEFVKFTKCNVLELDTTDEDIDKQISTILKECLKINEEMNNE